MALRVAARLGRDQQRLAAEVDGLARCLFGQFEIDERNIAGTQGPAIERAEIDCHAVVRLGRSISEFDGPALVEAEIAQTPGRKNQLARETAIVERARTILAAEGAVCFVVLAQKHIAVRAGTKIWILVQGTRLLHPTGIARILLEFGKSVIGRA